MTNQTADARASLAAELLLFHAVLGRGYISPFPRTKGLVFTSALPGKALDRLSDAEVMFAKWHRKNLEEENKKIEALEMALSNQDSRRTDHYSSVTGGAGGEPKGTKDDLKKMKERAAMKSQPTWKEDQVTKATLTEIANTHYYGAYTYVDLVGSRIAASLCHYARLAGDLSWVTLTEGTTDETLIRGNATGGANIHSLAGSEAIFNHFSSCQIEHLDHLQERIKDSISGHVGMGSTVILKGERAAYSGTKVETLYRLMTEVYSRGESRDPGNRTKVEFSPDSAASWTKFLDWELSQLIEVEEPTDWQRRLARKSPTSPENSVLFGARAAMVAAFIEHAESRPHGPIVMVELSKKHLQVAQQIAKYIYHYSSGMSGYEKRAENLHPGGGHHSTPQKLAVAKVAIEEALKAAPNGRLSRNNIRRGVHGATLGLLDELVTAGDITELSGTEECQMGQTRKAYCLPKDAPAADPTDAWDEYSEALEDFEEYPEAFLENDALKAVRRLRERAEEMNREHAMPVVPLSRMSKSERNILPKILSVFGGAFMLRGPNVTTPEPTRIMEDTDAPIDRVGANLWVRHNTKGDDFCNWRQSGYIGLEQWAEDEVEIEEHAEVSAH